MKNIIIDKLEEKQTRIDQKRDEVIKRYPFLWAKMISEWNSQGKDDLVWMMYSANYLFRTANVRWAIDPLSLNWRIPDAPKMDLNHDLQTLSFVLLTHSHKDHLDFDLISSLQHLPILWVVPEFLIPLVLEKTELNESQIIVPHPLQPIEIEGFRIIPFEGQHLVTNPDGTSTGVLEMGYLVEYKDKRWLFPGDTRIYEAKRFPTFNRINTLFAHLWLGRGAALVDPPQLIEAFCQFCADFKPERVILTHIEELGRDADDFWDTSHVKNVISQFRWKYPDIPIVPARLGECVRI